jgi:hypothetical protein
VHDAVQALPRRTLQTLNCHKIYVELQNEGLTPDPKLKVRRGSIGTVRAV